MNEFYAGGVELNLVDPETGEKRLLVHFDTDDRNIEIGDRYYEANGRKSAAARRMFSPELDRVVVSAANTSGEGTSASHVGWLDRAGRFTDVSALSQSSDFESATSDSAPSFDSKGRFWFARSSDINITMFRLDPGSDELEKGPSFTSDAYTLTPDDSPQAHDFGDKTLPVDEKRRCGPANDYSSAKNRCIGRIGIANNLWLVAPFTQATVDRRGDPLGTDRHERWADLLLPDTNLDVDMPIFKRDGSQVAFVREDSTGTGGLRLYTVPTEGGTPTRVPLESNLEMGSLVMGGVAPLQWN